MSRRVSSTSSRPNGPTGLIRSWNDAGWIDAPRRAGARIARLIGAGEDEVTVADSTSVNLFKLLVAAARLRPGRSVLLYASGDFPTDRYIVESAAEMLGLDAVCAGPDPDARDRRARRARRGARALARRLSDPAGSIRCARFTAAAHAAGAWRCGTSATAPASSTSTSTPRDVDFAVGCGYKYLNGGPGRPRSPTWRAGTIGVVRQPLTGWLGHAAAVRVRRRIHARRAGIDRLQCGTPPMLSLLALESALEAFDGVDVAALRRKSRALGDLFIRLVRRAARRARLRARVAARRRACAAARCRSPHPRGYAVIQALIATRHHRRLPRSGHPALRPRAALRPLRRRVRRRRGDRRDHGARENGISRGSCPARPSPERDRRDAARPRQSPVHAGAARPRPSTATRSRRASAAQPLLAACGSSIRSCCAPPCRRSARPKAGASSTCAASASASSSRSRANAFSSST